MVFESTTPTDPWTTVVPVIAAVIAACAATAVAAFSWWSQRSFRKADELARRRQRSTDYHRKQLDELYGTMFLLRSTSRRLWSRLHEQGEDFRLIDNIAAIKGEASDRRRRIVQQILDINARLANLIETRASLLVGGLPPPESFMAFLDHQRALATLWDMGEDADGREPSFPRNLDDDIKEAIDTVQTRLLELDD